MGTLKEDMTQAQIDIRNLNTRLIGVEKRLEVVYWLLGIATAVITAVAISVSQRLLTP